MTYQIKQFCSQTYSTAKTVAHYVSTKDLSRHFVENLIVKEPKKEVGNEKR